MRTGSQLNVSPEPVEPEGLPEEPEPTPVDAPVVPAAEPERVQDAEMAPAQEAPAKPAIRKIDAPDAQPVDLLASAGSPVAKRVGPILAGLAVLWLLKKLFGRNR